MFLRQQNKIDKNNNCLGFTLIEVLIAMAVFAIGILAIFSMQVTATNGNALARVKTENYTCALDKVEELMALPYDDPFLRVGVHPDDYNDFTQASDSIDNDGDGEVDEGGETGYITIRWQVWENIAHDQNIKSVRVTVEPTFNANKGIVDQRRRVNIDFFKANM